MNLPVELQAIIFNKANFKTKLLLRSTCNLFASFELIFPFECQPRYLEDNYRIKIPYVTLVKADDYQTLKRLPKYIFDNVKSIIWAIATPGTIDLLPPKLTTFINRAASRVTNALPNNLANITKIDYDSLHLVDRGSYNLITTMKCRHRVDGSVINNMPNLVNLTSVHFSNVFNFNLSSNIQTLEIRLSDVENTYSNWPPKLVKLTAYSNDCIHTLNNFPNTLRYIGIYNSPGVIITDLPDDLHSFVVDNEVENLIDIVPSKVKVLSIAEYSSELMEKFTQVEHLTLHLYVDECNITSLPPALKKLYIDTPDDCIVNISKLPKTIHELIIDDCCSINVCNIIPPSLKRFTVNKFVGNGQVSLLNTNLEVIRIDYCDSPIIFPNTVKHVTIEYKNWCNAVNLPDDVLVSIVQYDWDTPITKLPNTVKYVVFKNEDDITLANTTPGLTSIEFRNITIDTHFIENLPPNIKYIDCKINGGEILNLPETLRSITIHNNGANVDIPKLPNCIKVIRLSGNFTVLDTDPQRLLALAKS